MDNRYKLIVLMILDGWGVAPPGPGNAITLAKTPNMNKLWTSNPHGYLHASGSAVGLPHGTQGNSEVGHINIGAGKVVYQDLPRIDTAINNQTFYQNEALLRAIEHAKKNNGRVHIMGIISTGKVHGSLTHLFALIKTCAQNGLVGDQVMVHAFTDGRDTNPNSAKTYLEELKAEMERQKAGRYASVCGRYFAMDRDERWDRTKKAYDLIVRGEGNPVPDVFSAIDQAYQSGDTDEFIKPHVVVDESNNPVGTVKDGDSIIFSNYRPDRAIQLTKAFILPNLDKFERQFIKNLVFVGMSEYEKDLPMDIAFPPEDIKMPIGRIVSDLGMRQLRIAESEKFPHVTYFINGGREDKFPGEDRIEIPSPKVATYDLKPEMSAYEVTEELVKRIEMGIYNFIVVNYANGDMVSHTGIIPATVRSIEILDECVGKVVQAVLAKSGHMVITSDHGNAEENVNLHTGEVDTEHSTNPVPFIFVSKDPNPRELQFGILADIVPTILSAWGIPKPSEMTGRDLLA